MPETPTQPGRCSRDVFMHGVDLLANGHGRQRKGVAGVDRAGRPRGDGVSRPHSLRRQHIAEAILHPCW